jgi:hypothetical protein
VTKNPCYFYRDFSKTNKSSLTYRLSRGTIIEVKIYLKVLGEGMDLNTRLGLLVSSDAISENVATVVRKIVHRLDNNWKISLSEENGGHIITHLAMALMRSENTGVNEVLRCDSIESAKELAVFPRAIEITEDCIHYAGISITDDEKELLETRLCSVLRDR